MSASKFYVHYSATGVPCTEATAIAEYGFRQRGVETVAFQDINQLESLTDLGAEVGIAGYIGDVWEGLRVLSLPRPVAVDYPEELKSYLGREIESTDFATVRETTHLKKFVKPHQQKLFTGFLCTGEFKDQLKMTAVTDPATPMWTSTPVNFLAEYRCFVCKGELLGVRWYKGDWGKSIDRQIVERAVGDYTQAPASYALDFGITDDGRTLLVEANDGYALGSYGLTAELYAGMLDARWEELTQDLHKRD